MRIANALAGGPKSLHLAFIHCLGRERVSTYSYELRTSLKHNRSTLTEFVDNSLAEDFSMEPWTGGVPHTADQQRCLNNCEDQAEGLPSLAVEKMGIVLEGHVQGELCYLSYERSNINERIQPTPRTL